MSIADVSRAPTPITPMFERIESEHLPSSAEGKVVTVRKRFPSADPAQAELKKKRIEEQAQKIEKMFVTTRKETILDALHDWKRDFAPAAAYGLSFIPCLNRVIQNESTGCIDALIEDLEQANSRKKIAKIIDENLLVIENGKVFVNTATATKLDEATAILNRERKELGTIPTSPQKVVKEKKFPKVSGDETLLKKKTEIYDKLTAWKKSFTPTPFYALSYIPGVATIIQDKADVIYSNFVKKISRATKEDEVQTISKTFKNRMSDFRMFLDAASAEKLDEGINILSAHA